jgi:hypothetical protein
MAAHAIEDIDELLNLHIQGPMSRIKSLSERTPSMSVPNLHISLTVLILQQAMFLQAGDR